MVRTSLLFIISLFILEIAQAADIRTSINSDSSDSISWEKNVAKIHTYEYSNIDSAIILCKQLLIESEKSKNNLHIAYSRYYLGGLYDTKGIFQKASKNYFEALYLFKRIGNTKGIASCLNCIGILLWEQSGDAAQSVKIIKLNKAINYIDDALTYFKTIDFKSGIAICYMNEGIVNNDLGKSTADNTKSKHYYNVSIHKYRKAISLFSEINDQRSIADCNLNVALLLFDMSYNDQDTILTKKELLTIEDYLKNALLQYKKSKDIYGESMVLKNMATARFEYAKRIPHNKILLRKANDDALLSLRLADSVKALFLEYDAYNILYEINKRIKNPELALYYHELYTKVRDSVHNSEYLKNMEKREAEYALEKNQQIIVSQKRKNQIQRDILIGITISLILIFVLVLVLIRVNHQRKIANIALNNKNQELQQLNKTQNQIMSIISHDLMAPISAFYTIAHSLKSNINTLDDNELDYFIQRMCKSSLGLKLQLENLLDWSISQSSTIRVFKNKTNISLLVDRILIVLEEFANEKNIKINNLIDNKIELFTDVRLLGIVFNNLITNAIKFTQKGGSIEISISSKANSWVICVADNGIGISEDEIENIFIQKDHISNIENKGAGLGLVVSKDIVDKLGGRIWLNSEVNVGTSFYIEFEK